jgi:hypothetical protein
MDSIKRQARVAGLLYLLIGVTAPLSLVYTPGRLIVSGDATATAERIRAAELLLRISIASELFHQAVAVFLLLALYRLFKPVNVDLARHLVALGALVSVPIMFANTLNEFAALILAKGADFLAPFTRPQLDALAYLFLQLHDKGILVTSVFWGLWLLPFALLVIRSGFIPPLFGYLQIAGGIGYVAAAFTGLVFPAHTSVVAPVALVFELGEVPIIFWLLIRGARERPAAPAPRFEART